ncbi:disease resistance protein RPV1-like [Bidens hawaiensis]|uniref:disease resistance protein RPV1-like n=1 Tax=Bidens hawaiensis TaxID=980011 RepID=UPI00404B3BA4
MSGYEVFISFRGEDTRYNFTDHLLNALKDAAINAFYDDEGLRIGDVLKPKLENAIKSSKSSVIVLSENYASSTWCLDELALIMEQQDHIVYPIFYHVIPSDVRKQRNSFGKAMAEHTHRMEVEPNEENRSQLAQKIQKWKKALADVANMKGVEANGRETELIEVIVKDISSRLELHKRSEIPNLFGMEDSVRIITSFLKDGSEQSTEFLTIWGMAGIGKTYLADYIFESHYQKFDRSCFLRDTERKGTSPDGLLDLQKQLLEDTKARCWKDIKDVSVGTSRIENSISGKRTLLVLDGIDTVEQLDALLGTKGLHTGSKVIITSKNELLTEKCRLFETQAPSKHTKHKLRGLKDMEALRLLSWHAFGRNEPNESDKLKATKVVEYCQGHPLALKVLGSSFRNDDDTWDDILESLGKEIKPNIEKVLRISFDALTSEQDKKLFKHIACLFVGEDRKFTEEILKACGVCKPSGVKTLINRCLLTIEYPDKLMMHQLLQDMGRDIVRQESPEMPWERSILWKHDECLDVLQHKQRTTIIQGLALDMRRSRVTKGCFETHALSEMHTLRLLQLNYVQFCGPYKNFPQGLRWLCMHGFPLSYIPLDIQMENMVALDMSNSKLQQLWKKPKQLSSLKFLNLSNCYELVRVGHFSGLPQLEKLTLAGCTNLVEVCESIGVSCPQLEVLDLRKCDKLTRLPRSIQGLKNLTQLLFDGSSNLDELFKVGKDDDIKLKSHGTSFSTTVPRSSKSLVSHLPKSSTSSKSLVSHLPKPSTSSKSLVSHFPKSSTSSKSLVSHLPKPSTSSKSLVSHAPKSSSSKSLVSHLPKSPTSSKSLVSHVPKSPISSESFVSYLPRSLVTLSLINCNLSNKFFPMEFSSLPMLKELNLDGNPVDSMPDCVKSLKKLERLTFTWCSNLKTILHAPIQLTYFGIERCDSLEQITFDPDKPALPEFMYFDSINVAEIQYKFKMQALSEIGEEVLSSLGWIINTEYLEYFLFSIADCHGYYTYTEKRIPMQMLFEHGIFSTYLQGQGVPKWFTQRSNGSLFTLQSSPKNGKIRGLNVCVVRTVSSMKEVGPSRIEIRNLTKNSSWTYEPRMYLLLDDDEFKHGDEVVVVWLSHWMLGNNEFEDGDQVSIHFTVKYNLAAGLFYMCYGGEGPDYANVREYGISLVYDDDDDDGGDEKEDPMGYYKSWKHIFGKDLSAFEVSSSHGHYLLTPSPNNE